MQYLSFAVSSEKAIFTFSYPLDISSCIVADSREVRISLSCIPLIWVTDKESKVTFQNSLRVECEKVGKSVEDFDVIRILKINRNER